jgi:hypothetical protein
MRRDFLQGRIDALEAIIIAYEEAILALSTSKVFQYTLNTGQGSQTVTKADLIRMRKDLAIMYNDLCMLKARLNGGNTNIARPVW